MIGDRAPGFLLRTVGLVVAWWFASIPHNPIVRFEALVGISPSPLEKLGRIRGPFSGMTEGFYQLAHLRIAAAVEANLFTPLVAAVFAVCVLFGIRPRITNRRQELAFFVSVAIVTVIVNWHA